jgi:hypothetical protein
MADSISWAVDRLAANTLFARLRLKPTADMLEQAAAQFAEHRKNSIGWAAERAHSSIVQKLESASMERFGRETDDWRNGFCFAEQQVMTTRPEELLELGPDRSLSKGQVLRALVREARSR